MPTRTPSPVKTAPLVPEIVTGAARLQHGSETELEQLRRLAGWMDSAIQIPGTKVSVGVDALLGLLPGVGDFISALISLRILQAAQRSGVSRLTISRMAANLILDSLFGVVPVAGDVFDVFWKANSKNVALLQRHLDADPAAQRRVQRSDRLFFGLVVSVLIVVVFGSMTLAYLGLRWLLQVA